MQFPGSLLRPRLDRPHLGQLRLVAQWRLAAETEAIAKVDRPAALAAIRVTAAGGLDKDFAYVQNWFDWMRAHGRISHTPKARRLVFYDWYDTPDGANHIGMVDHFDSSHIWAWEGNKDNEVKLVERPRDSQIMGYGEWWDHIAKPAPAADGSWFLGV